MRRYSRTDMIAHIIWPTPEPRRVRVRRLPRLASFQHFTAQRRPMPCCAVSRARARRP